MITIPAHSHNYKQANRTKKDIQWIVIHDAEAKSAIGVANYFQNPKLAKPVSSHFVVGDYYPKNDLGSQGSLVIRCVEDKDIAYTQGIANAWSLSIELQGFASYSESDWWEKHEDTLYAAAMVVTYWSRKYEIPIELLDNDEVAYSRLDNSWVKGITTHAAITKAFNILGGHVDPGPNFPLEKFLQMCRDVKELPEEYQL